MNGIVTHSSMTEIAHNHVSRTTDDGHLDDRDVDGDGHATTRCATRSASASTAATARCARSDKNVVIGTRSDRPAETRRVPASASRCSSAPRPSSADNELTSRTPRRSASSRTQSSAGSGSDVAAGSRRASICSARARKLSYGGTSQRERVGHAHDHVEERRDVDRVDERLVADARRAHRVGVGRRRARRDGASASR